eukprot:TRINITY_DN8024_c0_g1_i2.p1 TRINITY_DN8024_c0_g1~~TRINITY_DN8024_c0_g1_i2.p1  ORF type:complete len:116 (-),score=14.40 TRINITY_DN8024_c0_g1_i2:92-439(-)
MDSTWFEAIPTLAIRSVEFKADRGVTSKKQIRSRPPMCGCCTCYCCPCCCLKKWIGWGSVERTAKNIRKIKLGVLMPPWEEKTMIVIEVHPDAPLQLIQTFIADLQNASPKLRAV